MQTAQALADQGAALVRSGRYADAAAIYQAIPLPQMTVSVACNLGLSLYKIGRLDDARHWLDLARRQSDDPALRRLRLQLANAFLTAGRYREGWDLWEERIGLDPSIPVLDLGFPEWRGEPLEGKTLLVWHEQGFGDQIMMARLVRQLADRGARVTVTCRPALSDLMATAEGVAAVIPVIKGEPIALPVHDYWVRIFSLPHRLGVAADGIPGRPYLSAPPGVKAPPVGGQVGAVWRTLRTSETMAHRSLPDELGQVLMARGTVSLDPADTGAVTFGETAALVERLSLVVTVDTAMAHLAGALGRPVWVMLPYEPDWRWTTAFERSPWYPAARMFRQPRPGAWREVLDQVIAAMAAEGITTRK